MAYVRTVSGWASAAAGLHSHTCQADATFLADTIGMSKYTIDISDRMLGQNRSLPTGAV